MIRVHYDDQSNTVTVHWKPSYVTESRYYWDRLGILCMKEDTLKRAFSLERVNLDPKGKPGEVYITLVVEAGGIPKSELEAKINFFNGQISKMMTFADQVIKVIKLWQEINKEPQDG